MSVSEHSAATSSVCLVLCLKAPARSKRRMAAQIGEHATTAADHLWACALEDTVEWPGSICFAPAEVEDGEWLSDQLDDASEIILQEGNSLGERINHVDKTLRLRGKQQIIFVGTDCPSMQTNYLIHAARELNNFDVVLGPAVDGGVVLMATRKPWPSLQDLPWSTETLREALVERVTHAGMTIAMLEPRADIDSVAGLRAARLELVNDRRPARRSLHRWLDESCATWEQPL
jgi:uncharacterized protein